MVAQRRVTLRCLVDDLQSDWNLPKQHTDLCNLQVVIGRRLAGESSDSDIARSLALLPKLNRVDHPLVRHFDDQFAGGGGTLEKISSVADHLWWKQKSGRWRGAAAVLDYDGDQTAWLAAAGLRAEGDARDFYSVFAARGTASSSHFLPNEEDNALLVVDRKISRRDAWLMQIHLSSLVLLANSQQIGSAGPLDILTPDQRPLLSISMSVATVEQDGDALSEVVIAMQDRDRKAGKTAEEARKRILASIQPEASEWQVGLLPNDVLTYATLIPQALAATLDYVRAHGELPADSPLPALRVGTMAHYSERSGLTRATVEGEAVEAVCGYWFVPRHDHADLEVCDKCQAARENYPE